MTGSQPTPDPSRGWLRTEQRAETLLLSLGGRWNMACAERFEGELRRLEPAAGQPVRIDLAQVESLDTAGAWLLHRLAKRLGAADVDIAFENVKAAHAELLARLGSLEEHCLMEPPRANALAAIVARIGQGAIDLGVEVGEYAAFLGLTITSAARLCVQPKRFRLSAVIHHMEHAGLNAIPIVALISFLIGVVVAYQGAIQLRRFGAEIFVVDLVAVSVLRELGILLTAIIVAGRSGSAFTAQIGAMKINEEIDAMRTIGLDPMQVLVVPRLLALLFVMPLLGFVADVMGLVGGGVIAMIELGISPGQYIARLDTAFAPWSLGVGLLKAPLFGFIIALTGCYMGLKVVGSSESLGRLTTRSVVHAIFTVIVVDAVFSILFDLLGI